MKDQTNLDSHHARREEVDFKLTARRNKLLGLWVADRLGLSGDAAESYAKEVVLADLDEPGVGDLIRKVKGDLEAKSISIDEDQIRAKLTEYTAEVREALS